MAVNMAQDRVALQYIVSLLQPTTNVLRKRVTFERSDQRITVAKKVSAEAKQLQKFFHKVAGDMADFDSPFKAIEALAEVLNCDNEMLALDIGNLVKKYPDVSHDQLLCLLTMRNDMVIVLNFPQLYSILFNFTQKNFFRPKVTSGKLLKSMHQKQKVSNPRQLYKPNQYFPK